MTLTAAYLDAMNKLVDMGIYHDHQDAIRDGLRQLFRFHQIQPFFPELIIEEEVVEPEALEEPEEVAEEVAQPVPEAEEDSYGS